MSLKRLLTCVLGMQIASPSFADLVLSRRIMNLALTGAELSSLAYQENPPRSGYQRFALFTDGTFYCFDLKYCDRKMLNTCLNTEPNQAIVAKKDGYCYASFRGSVWAWTDWQALDFGEEKICVEEEKDGFQNCCSTRRGFYKTYNTSYKKKMEAAIRRCAKSCTNPDECVVFTGHSQGGAIAALAALSLPDLNPYIMTFGQPATIDAPCDMITSERLYRFVNTNPSDHYGIIYDPVPFVPGLGADIYGYMILIGEDNTGVSHIGADIKDNFPPLNPFGLEAHSMNDRDGYPGYIDRLKALMGNSSSFPVRSDGYADGALCAESKECLSGYCGHRTPNATYSRCMRQACQSDSECAAGQCIEGFCVHKFGSCRACQVNNDCASGKCRFSSVCSGPNGLMDNECICKLDTDCASGRCDLPAGVCKAKLGTASYCTDDASCLSGFCSPRNRCEDSAIVKAFEREGINQAPCFLGIGWKNIMLTIFCLVGSFCGVQYYIRYQKGYERIPTEVSVMNQLDEQASENGLNEYSYRYHHSTSHHRSWRG